MRRREGLVVLSYIWCVFPPPSPSPPRLARPVESLLQTRCWGHGARFFRGFFSFSLAGFSLGFGGSGLSGSCPLWLFADGVVYCTAGSPERFAFLSSCGCGAVRWVVRVLFFPSDVHARTHGGLKNIVLLWMVDKYGGKGREGVR